MNKNNAVPSSSSRDVEQLAQRVAELERRLRVSRIYSESFLARAFAIGWHTLAACVIVFVLTVMPIRILADVRASNKAESQPSIELDAEKEAIAAFMRKHSSWMHEHDRSGQVIRDPRTGKFVLTPNGKRFVEYITEAEAKGIRKGEDLVKYAFQKLAADGAVIPQQ